MGLSHDIMEKFKYSWLSAYNWSMLNAVNGRIVDVFKLSDGNRIDGEYFTHLFYELNDVKQFQVRQDKIDHILVKLVMFDNEERKADETKKVIESGIYKVMGSDINIDFEFVDNIPFLHQARGLIRFLIFERMNYVWYMRLLFKKRV